MSSEEWKPDLEGLRAALPGFRSELDCPICSSQRGYCAEHRPSSLADLIAAADGLADAWRDGGWRISASYSEIEVAYERYLLARGRIGGPA